VIARAGIVGLLLLLLISCTAAVRYSNNPDNQNRPKKHERERQAATETTTATGASDTQQDQQGDGEFRLPHEQKSQLDRTRMNRIIANYLGTPYEYGGTGKMGIDCSGLMYVLYRDYNGTRLPLSTEALFRLDGRVEYDNLSYGDLVFFRLSGRKVSHVGMYLENGRFVHASESHGVTVDDITTEYYATSYAGARRIR